MCCLEAAGAPCSPLLSPHGLPPTQGHLQPIRPPTHPPLHPIAHPPPGCLRFKRPSQTLTSRTGRLRAVQQLGTHLCPQAPLHSSVDGGEGVGRCCIAPPIGRRMNSSPEWHPGRSAQCGYGHRGYLYVSLLQKRKPTILDPDVRGTHRAAGRPKRRTTVPDIGRCSATVLLQSFRRLRQGRTELTLSHKWGRGTNICSAVSAGGRTQRVNLKPFIICPFF